MWVRIPLLCLLVFTNLWVSITLICDFWLHECIWLFFQPIRDTFNTMTELGVKLRVPMELKITETVYSVRNEFTPKYKFRCFYLYKDSEEMQPWCLNKWMQRCIFWIIKNWSKQKNDKLNLFHKNKKLKKAILSWKNCKFVSQKGNFR